MSLIILNNRTLTHGLEVENDIEKRTQNCKKKWYVYMLFGALPWQHV